MASEEERSIQDHFAERASSYGAGPSWVNDACSLRHVHDEWLRRRPGSLIDVGAGTGAATAFLQPQENSPLVVDCDVSLPMLRAVDRAQSQSGRRSVVADAEALPFSAGSFDMAICRQAFHYFGSPVTAAREVYRVLSAHSVFVVSQIVPFDEEPDLEWWTQLVRMRQPSRRHELSRDSICDVLRASGFVFLRTEEYLARSSLDGWLRRYDCPVRTQAGIRQHFASAPRSVAERRKFEFKSQDVEYTIRWVTVTGEKNL